MATFTCGRYPHLRIGHAVRFTDGVAEVDAADARALRDFARQHPDYGITETTPPPAPDAAPKKAPRRRSGGRDE
ncbi:hypothetical protein [Streptomyces sp. CC228A]|uniref:hypothetical protein n=1 Tax=Streptomyces sp. CC228A TaxID=2898186 RepID=UPI001F408C1A|nr:hypothetical protein [Streptomyces sp. CC228A]